MARGGRRSVPCCIFAARRKRCRAPHRPQQGCLISFVRTIALGVSKSTATCTALVLIVTRARVCLQELGTLPVGRGRAAGQQGATRGACRLRVITCRAVYTMRVHGMVVLGSPRGLGAGPHVFGHKAAIEVFAFLPGATGCVRAGLLFGTCTAWV